MLSTIRIFLHYSFFITLLILAASVRVPYLLWARDYLFFIIVTVSFASAVFFLRRLCSPLQKKRHVKLFFSLSVLAFLTVLMVEGKFRFQKHHMLHAPNQTLKTLSAHVIVGYQSLEDLEELILKDGIAGIFITKRNVEGKSYDEVKNGISHLQKLRLSRGLPKLLITTDQEGGIVSRLSPPLSTLPALASLSTLSKEQQQKEALKYGEKQGKELHDLGINVNFSPVLDIKYRDDINPLDFHSLISKRSISNDQSVVANIALPYVLGLEKNHIIATLKHFPGMGRVTDDTHHFSATLHTKKELLALTDWMPFKKLIKESQPFMMLGHVILSEIDEVNPASSSKAVITQIIRNQWGHDGVLITDDLTMKSYGGKIGACQSSVLSLNAGVDLLLISYDFDKYYEIMHCLLEAEANGDLDHDALQKSKVRINRTRQQILGY